MSDAGEPRTGAPCLTRMPARVQLPTVEAVIFERVLVGNDGSPAAMTALRVARAIAVPDATFLALTVAEIHLAAHAGMEAPEWDKRLRADAETARLAAERELRGEPNAEARMVTGYAAQRLLTTIDTLDADLVAVGSHGHSRAAGILLGSVATRLIHDAPCSVLVAHGDVDTERFPRRILVGVDSSEASGEAAVIAESLALASGAELRRLTATGGKPLPEEAVLTAELDVRSPVDALVAAGQDCDLLVLGSRGLHGPAALGSVAERVAHRASCPVLA
jgi:nucleotide-binding universal stress UspA family protein